MLSGVGERGEGSPFPGTSIGHRSIYFKAFLIRPKVEVQVSIPPVGGEATQSSVSSCYQRELWPALFRKGTTHTSGLGAQGYDSSD